MPKPKRSAGEKKKSPAEKKAKPSSVKKTDGKESTSPQVAEVVVEQPLVDKTGGKTVTETTSVVASSETVSLSEEQKALFKSLSSRATSTPFPTNEEIISTYVGKEGYGLFIAVLVLGAFFYRFTKKLNIVSYKK